MSVFLGSPVPRSRPEPDQARTLEMIATLVLVALVLVMLYAGRDIFIPIAIAILLSFVLSPPILLLRRWGLGRVLSVLTIVLAALVVTFLVSAVVTRQVSEFAVDLPKYQRTITAKIDNLRNAAADNALFTKVSAALKNLGEINPRRPASPGTPAPSDKALNRLIQPEEAERPIPVEVHEPAPGPFAIAQTIAGTAFSPLETTFIVIVFVVFILLQREDLRNRFIRLVGSGDLQRTTMAMNDAAARLSRFFLFQTLVNAFFGIIIAVGLYFIGLPSPILWGIVAFLLRFVPYIGAVIAAGFPLALAASIDPGWGIALQTLALFLIVEPIIGQVVEPWLYGHHTGISPIAVVVSATFWTWLWGPVGLVLSTPLMVCLVVLGRHVERLAFLDIIFGDAPPLTPVETFYQRMLAGDASEVVDQAERFLKTHSLIDYYDEVALKALLMAQLDLRRGVLDELRHRRIMETIGEVIEDLSDHGEEPSVRAPEPEHSGLEKPGDTSLPTTLGFLIDAKKTPPDSPSARHPPGQMSGGPVLCIAGRSFLDEAAASLLAQVLEKHGVEAKVEPAGVLTAGRISHLSAGGVRFVCLSYFDAELSTAGARFAVRRMRRHLGQIKILGGFWQEEPAQGSALCVETKVDFCAATFKEALVFCLQRPDRVEKAEPIETAAKPAAKTFS